MAAFDTRVAWAAFHEKIRELIFEKMLMIDCVCIGESLKDIWLNVKLHCVSYTCNCFFFIFGGLINLGAALCAALDYTIVWYFSLMRFCSYYM